MQPNGQHDQYPWPPQRSEYEDLDGYGAQAAPEHAFAVGIDTLANGDYDCEFTAAGLERAANGDRICRASIRLLSAHNRTVEHTYWLNRQESVNAFLAEMAALGFPAQTWGAGPGKVPLSQAVPQCVAQLRGVRFRATKTSRLVPAQPAKPGLPARAERTFHDLRINGRITGAPMPAIGPAPAPHQPAQQVPAYQQPVHPATATAPAGMLADDQIPF